MGKSDKKKCYQGWQQNSKCSRNFRLTEVKEVHWVFIFKIFPIKSFDKAKLLKTFWVRNAYLICYHVKTFPH